ncbi:uncharacterized protein BCR38DRAFT_427889 [Pseudomassariella vexata]|uniref:Uncharacterized protein n=1 Tax=Pseudomassariella vexata TaxID=1141098 RepID=A0A1Y2E816_9PEZI|nr:uncharacterized protein BCR38DRAFT_427889 [Pseudomassariella vexata]ORY67682.1 hypothetical protein BCR38DRAFT_427889 [Pseudomassariella vexata]
MICEFAFRYFHPGLDLTLALLVKDSLVKLLMEDTPRFLPKMRKTAGSVSRRFWRRLLG